MREHRALRERLCADARPAQIDARDLEALLDPVFAAGMAKEHIPARPSSSCRTAASCSREAYGVADVASGRAVLPDRTIFPIASISKVFTATA
jgi:CubicO group peptidase (beta-lactamase class C family)